MPELWRDGDSRHPTLVLAHGSGQGADSEWMVHLTAALVENSIYVVRFDFDYMKAAREAGKPRPPARLPKLLEEYRAVVASLGEPCFVGGKSLGGRVASHLCTELDLPGLACFGYPFHPPGKPDKLRTDHLPDLKCPALVCQGERDPFGKRAEVESYGLPKNVQVHWLQDGDHQLKPPKSSPASLEANISEAARRCRAFIEEAL